MSRRYVDAVAAAAILGTHPDTVKRLIRQGKLSAEKLGTKYVIDEDYLRGDFAPRYPDMVREGMREGQRRGNHSPKRVRAAKSGSAA